jgi:hypothetical protein
MSVMLAILGIYGVVATAVSRRAGEMGIRIALGAQSKDIYHAVLGASGWSVYWQAWRCPLCCFRRGGRREWVR